MARSEAQMVLPVTRDGRGPARRVDGGRSGATRDASAGRGPVTTGAEAPLPGATRLVASGASPSRASTPAADLSVPATGPPPEPPEPAEGVSPGVRRVTVLAVLVVAGVAALASYDHQRVLAELAGEGWRAWLLPLSVDGLVVAASMSMLVRHRTGERAGVLAWLAFAAGLGASLAANVAAAEPTLVGRLVAAWPPVALAVSYELLMQQTRTRRGGSEVGRQARSHASTAVMGGR